MNTTPTPEQIVEQLRAMQERIRAKAEEQMAFLDETIRIVLTSGGLPADKLVPLPGPVRPDEADEAHETNGPSVGEMVLAAAKELGDVVLDHCKDGNLRERAVALYPGHEKKILRGIFGAVNYLLGNGTFVRVPGGYRLKKEAQ